MTAALIAVALVGVTVLQAAPTGAVTSVPTDNGATWQIHDAAPPVKNSTGIARKVGPTQGSATYSY